MQQIHEGLVRYESSNPTNSRHFYNAIHSNHNTYTQLSFGGIGVHLWSLQASAHSSVKDSRLLSGVTSVWSGPPIT